MSQISPRFMIVVWRWRSGHQHVAWSLDRPQHQSDCFFQLNLPADQALNPLTELVSERLAEGNVLLFLHDNPSHGYSASFNSSLRNSVARKPASRKGQLYIRLFTGGREEIYCTPSCPRGILGIDGNFAADLLGEPVRVVIDETARVLNHEHFDTVWQHYWQDTRYWEKVGDLKIRFGRWAMQFDSELTNDPENYDGYLKKEPLLWKALVSFAQESGLINQMKEEDRPRDLQDFSGLDDHLTMIFSPMPDGKMSKQFDHYREMKKQATEIIKDIVEDHEATTQGFFNGLNELQESIYEKK